jgi:hypothetical protein
MVVACGELKPGTYVACGGGNTISIHVDNPLAGNVTLAISDDQGGHSAIILPQAQFDGAIQAYFDRSTS